MSDDGAIDEPVDEPVDGPVDGARGGSWLTYRYRLGGATAPAAGTIKAPSFLSATRRLVARRLGPLLGPEPAYLRLRAAGEEEVLVRITRGAAGAPATLAVVPADSHHFPEPPISPLPADEPAAP
jgi:hypothetical protein